jgi:hypothetical protein
MATIHTGTTMAPTKLELLTDWLPRQDWYLGEGPPELSRAGGFRLDDPAGEVGLEFMLVTDGAGGGATTYFVPLSYRGAPLHGADDALIGTSEHGVLGTRWIYDAADDPVAAAQLLAFVRGRVEAQHQSESDTPDPSVGRSWSPSSDEAAALSLSLIRVPRPGEPGPGLGSVQVDWRRLDGTTARGTVVTIR